MQMSMMLNMERNSMNFKKLVFLTIFISFSLNLICEPFEKCETLYSEDTISVFSLKENIKVQSSGSISIPVVVHVVYNSSSENISDSQITSQINVLNEDFRKMLNTPGYNTNSVGADVKIEFRLADRDPNNNSTNGITRHYSSQINYPNNSTSHQDLQNISYWDSDKYLNIWVVPAISSTGIGYAIKFPWQSGHPRGVVMASIYFGDNVGITTTPYHLGRTSTHEIGHYFGLYHTFQDGCSNGNCSSDGDKICDTPPCVGNFSCPITINSCSSDTPDLNDMIENYMDYTDDLCMNIFTVDQSTRMNSYIQTYYPSLNSSTGLTSNNFILFGEHVGDYDYNVTTNIVSKSSSPYSDLIIKNGSSANLRSKNEIHLQDGFHSESGNEFRAYIDNQLPSFPKTIKDDQDFNNPITGNTILTISPNPVTSISDISLTVGSADNVSLVLFDNLGNQRFSYLDNISLKSGTYNYKLDGNELNSGMFVLVLKIDGRIITEKIINLK